MISSRYWKENHWAAINLQIQLHPLTWKENKESVVFMTPHFTEIFLWLAPFIFGLFRLTLLKSIQRTDVIFICLSLAFQYQWRLELEEYLNIDLNYPLSPILMVLLFVFYQYLNLFRGFKLLPPEQITKWVLAKEVKHSRVDWGLTIIDQSMVKLERLEARLWFGFGVSVPKVRVTCREVSNLV